MRGCTTCSIIFAFGLWNIFPSHFFQCIFHYLGFVRGLFVHCLGSFSRLRSRHEDFLAGFYRNKAEKNVLDVLTLQLTSLSHLTFPQTLKLWLIER